MKYKGLLIDIDGTLVCRGRPIEGAVSAIGFLVANNIGFRLLSNMTSKTPTDIYNELCSFGFPVAEHQIQTAVTACSDFLRGSGGTIYPLMLPAVALSAFEGVVVDNVSPDYVVIGDACERINYENMNDAFNFLRSGARLIAMHKNPYWLDINQPKLDSGAFVAALEFASHQPAYVTGKPSRVFFQTALEYLKCSPGEVLVIGDDPATDVAGASEIGADALLVCTGKSSGHTQGCLNTISSIAMLPDYLNALPNA